MITRMEALEKKLKGLQHLIGATDEHVTEAHDESVALAAAEEDEAKESAAEDQKVAQNAILARAKAKK